MYPMIAREQHPIMIGPLPRILSDKKVHKMTAQKPAILGGTVNSWALTLSYPKLEMMDGKNKENE